MNFVFDGFLNVRDMHIPLIFESNLIPNTRISSTDLISFPWRTKESFGILPGPNAISSFCQCSQPFQCLRENPQHGLILNKDSGKRSIKIVLIHYKKIKTTKLFCKIFSLSTI